MTYAPYSRQGTPFGAPGPFYTPGIGHRGVDYYAAAGSPVVAYEDMTIEYVGHTGGLGTVVGARLAADGKHAGWAHLRNVRNFTNGWVPAGTQFAEVAGAGDSPGSLWAGAHIHTTLVPANSTSYAAANGNMPLEDPAPRIASSGSASAGRPQAQEAGWLMALSDDEQRELLNRLRNISGFLYEGGTSTEQDKPSKGNYTSRSLFGRVNNLEAALFRGGSSMPDGQPITTLFQRILKKLGA